MIQGLMSLLVLLKVSLDSPQGLVSPLADSSFSTQSEEKVLAQMPMDLTKRYDQENINEVFSDNIRLALWYLGGESVSKNIDWEKVRQDFKVSFVLKPGGVFAFHDQVLPSFAKASEGKPIKTMGSHFIAEEGYRSSGYLYGDGVCHLASLMNWAASKAGLGVVAKADHSFSPIFGVPSQYGTSIRYDKNGGLNTQNQNLYITNNFDFPVMFEFEIYKNNIEIKILRD